MYLELIFSVFVYSVFHKTDSQTEQTSSRAPNVPQLWVVSVNQQVLHQVLVSQQANPLRETFLWGAVQKSH